MVAKLDTTATYCDKQWRLASNEYADGTIDPKGFCYLDSFHLDGQIPVWRWRMGDALLEQRVCMAHGKNTTYVSYTLIRGASIDLEFVPLCTYRDYHSQHRGYRDTDVDAFERGVTVHAYNGARPYRIHIERGECSISKDWYWNFRHRAESERGLDDLEDLFRPALLHCTLKQGESTAVVLSAEDAKPETSELAFSAEVSRQQALLDLSLTHSDAVVTHAIDKTQLVLAADQFIVERRDADGAQLGATVIAGYPWFSDWGRDTMIALPGLTLATGRTDIAANILRTFAHFVSEGMLPNRFPDNGEKPEYNTVDAALWYVIAVEQYVCRTEGRALLAELYPVLREIVACHTRGTRFGIRVDPKDGLLAAGEPGAQLTWMDAKCGDWVVTPRIGKPVEINALWFNVLMAMCDFATQLREPTQARDYAEAAQRVRREFNERFWYETGGYLYDVIDTPSNQIAVDAQGRDASLRPNQIFAVSLRHTLLDTARARNVVDVCARELWTPAGLRSLATSDVRYAPHYQGGPRERDAVYHQGTVWSWLIGPFVSAYYRVYGDAPIALRFLTDINAHLREACVGQISEIFDGAAPHHPRGCFAQAWGVAEILRAWSEIDESESRDNIGRNDGDDSAHRHSTSKY
jgi:predicted glycogen debranching enzyme